MPGRDEVWFQTDTSWDCLEPQQTNGLTQVDVREEARGLRFITSRRKIEAFAARHAAQFRPFTLYGSGDFHHLSAVWTRQFTEPFSILSFDNHPDWDIRPPRWSCGAWINRALENPYVRNVDIWGCGNFECNFPGRLLGNRRAAQAGRLRVQPWRQEGQGYPAWLMPMARENWQTQFADRLQKLRGQKVYVTIDMDCLVAAEAGTNWENGGFTCRDLTWALKALHEEAIVLGGDLCGAWSQPRYATRFQALAGWFDHPRLATPDAAELGQIQRRTFSQLWRALTDREVG